jgi:hypothetical protein
MAENNLFNLKENQINNLLDTCTAKEIELFMLFAERLLSDTVFWYCKSKENRANIRMVINNKLILQVIYEFQIKRKRLL